MKLQEKVEKGNPVMEKNKSNKQTDVKAFGYFILKFILNIDWHSMFCIL